MPRYLTAMLFELATPITRRALLAGGLALAAMPAHGAGKPIAVTVWKDPACGCCGAWVERMRAAGFAPTVHTVPDVSAVKAKLGIPQALASCHTALVAGYALEGHVPPADVRRLLAEQPRHVAGLAVPGMPVGSPGMEVPGGRRDAFVVVAFGAAGTRAFARHAANPGRQPTG